MEGLDQQAASTSAGLNTLPDELCLRLLRLFEPKELLLVMALINHRWRSLALDDWLWRRLYRRRFFDSLYYTLPDLQGPPPSNLVSHFRFPRLMSSTSASSPIPSIVSSASYVSSSAEPHNTVDAVDMDKQLPWVPVDVEVEHEQQLKHQRTQQHDLNATNLEVATGSEESNEEQRTRGTTAETRREGRGGGSRGGWSKAYLKSHQRENAWLDPSYVPRRLILKGHTDGIRCLHFQDKILYSGARDAKARIWDLRSGRCLHQITAHTDSVQSIRAFGDQLVTGGSSTDREVKLWDTNTGQCIRSFKGHEEWICRLQIDGKTILSSSNDRTLKLWDINSGECIHTFSGHKDGVWCMQYDPDLIISAGAAADRKIRVWDMKTRQVLKTLKGHMGGIYCLHYARDLLWAGSTEEVRLWNFYTGDCLFADTDENPSFVMGIQFDSWKMVSGGYGSYQEEEGDIEAKIWVNNAPTGTPASFKVVKRLRGHTKAIRCMQYDEDILVTGALDGLLIVYNFEERGLPEEEAKPPPEQAAQGESEEQAS